MYIFLVLHDTIDQGVEAHHEVAYLQILKRTHTQQQQQYQTKFLYEKISTDLGGERHLALTCTCGFSPLIIMGVRTVSGLTHSVLRTSA